MATEESETKSPQEQKWVAVDDVGFVISGPFETEEEAWDALQETPYEAIGFAEPLDRLAGSQTMNQQNDALESLRQMNQIVWGTDWGELSPEAEAEAEKAYEHIAAAIDAEEDDE